MKDAIKYIVLAAIFTGLGYWMAPERVKIEERVVVKEVVKKDVITRVVERPDGTRETITEDKTTINTDTQADKIKTASKERKDWLVGGGLISDNIFKPNDFTAFATIQRRILGEVYMGVWGSNAGQFGLGFTLRF